MPADSERAGTENAGRSDVSLLTVIDVWKTGASLSLRYSILSGMAPSDWDERSAEPENFLVSGSHGIVVLAPVATIVTRTDVDPVMQSPATGNAEAVCLFA